VGAADLLEKRRRWSSSSVAAGMTFWSAVMNWMRASSRVRGASESLVTMTRMGRKPWWR
jgi:hypothetical protein